VPWLTHYSLVSHTGVQAQSPISPCEVCGVQSGTETGFSPNTSVFPLSLSFHWCSTLIPSSASDTV